MKRVAVLGAGISGLACVFRLGELKKERSLDLETVVFEAGPRTGGSIQTEKRDGFLLEKGPDSFITERPAVIDLCRRLGLEQEILPTNEKHRKVFVVKNGKMVSLPEGFYLIAPTNIGAFMRTPLFSLAGKMRMAAEAFIPPASAEMEESVGSFIRRRFGKEALERVGQPMIAGIYSGDPEALSADAVLPQFKNLERQHGSVTRGLMRQMKIKRQAVSGPRYGLFLSFRGGMSTLTDAIVSRLPEGSVRLNQKTSVSRSPGSSQWILSGPDGKREGFDAVCLAISAGRAAEAMNGVDAELSSQLKRIRYESVATLNLAYKKEQVPHALDSFGLVAPAVEGQSFMACTFSSQKFAHRAPDDSVLIRAFIGGAFGRQFFEMGESQLVRAVTDDLTRLLGVKGPPDFYSLSRYPEALPQYEVGHQRLISTIEALVAAHAGLYITGSSYRGTGIAQSVQDGQRQAEKIVESLYNPGMRSPEVS